MGLLIGSRKDDDEDVRKDCLIGEKCDVDFSEIRKDIITDSARKID